MSDIVEASNQAEEDAAFLAGAKIVIRTDLLPPPPPPPPTYEDLTTYTEVDPKSALVVTTTQVSFASLSRATSSYLYKDFGVGALGTFNLDFIYNSSNYSGGYNVGIASVGNSLADVEATRLASGNLNCVLASSAGSICLHEIASGTEYNSSGFTTALNTNYYCTLSRTTTSATLKIYSDSARTILLQTLSLTLHAAIAYRYLLPVQSVNSGQSYWLAAVLSNFWVH